MEPLAGVFGAFAVVLAEPLLPYALAFAAGAMVYVVMDDIIPEAQIRLESDPSLICPWTLSQSQGLSLQIFPFFIFAPPPLPTPSQDHPTPFSAVLFEMKESGARSRGLERRTRHTRQEHSHSSHPDDQFCVLSLSLPPLSFWIFLGLE